MLAADGFPVWFVHLSPSESILADMAPQNLKVLTDNASF